MSTYLPMWDAINRMSHQRAALELTLRVPARGRSTYFQGLHVLDVDLIEALRFKVEETAPKKEGACST